MVAIVDDLFNMDDGVQAFLRIRRPAALAYELSRGLERKTIANLCMDRRAAGQRQNERCAPRNTHAVPLCSSAAYCQVIAARRVRPSEPVINHAPHLDWRPPGGSTSPEAAVCPAPGCLHSHGVHSSWLVRGAAMTVGDRFAERRELAVR